jgi:hypothetical protein
MPVSAAEAATPTRVPARRRGRRQGFWRTPISLYLWKRVLYAVTNLPLAVLSLVFVLLFLVLGTGLFIIWVGIPLLLLSFLLSRSLAGLHRAWAGWILGRPIPAPARRPRRGNGPLTRLAARIRDSWTWREIGFHILNAPLSVISGGLTLYVYLQTAYSLSYPFWAWNRPGIENLWGGPNRLAVVALHTLPGLVTLFLGPWLIIGCTRLQARTAELILGARSG